MRTYRVVIDGEEFSIGIGPDQSYTINETAVHADIRQTAVDQYSTLLDGRSSTILVGDLDGAYRVVTGSLAFEVRVEDERSRLSRMIGGSAVEAAARTEVRAPMPALVVRIEVKEGERVEPGRGLLVLEAMKMENEVKSAASGTVQSIAVVPGKPVEKGELLMVIS